MNSKLIILDRDGVINQDSDLYIKKPDEWHAIPGSLEAIARLCRADYRVVVITNQSGISRGLYSLNTLNKIHQKMIDEIHVFGGELNAVFFCPHSDEVNCECRKPKPGLFLELAERLRCDLDGVYAVGDSIRDLQAALLCGAAPVLVETGKGKTSMENIKSGNVEAIPMVAPDGTTINVSSKLGDVPIFPDLACFVDYLLNEEAVY
ncbi:MAG: D-glycero-beta-D-manno-heptose 1,7-bisphosphate 7-phosphatase [Gammaproteobacteria bacterium]|nr:D-glycero-beta-D-manno-heptose 1,7-bisphosphate 7-phosphatase [Gammaproteobacteria bacterium]